MNKQHDRIKLVLRLILAAVFIAAAAGKIIDPTDFLEDIQNYRLVPYFLAAVTAVVLPWLELFCAFFLIINRWVKPVAFILMVLNVVFIMAITSALWRGLDIECGCFSGSARVGIMRIVEDCLLLAASAMLFYLTGMEKND